MDLLEAESSIKNAKWYCDRREEKKAYELFFDALDGGKDCPELELTGLVAKRVSRSWQLLEDDVRAFLKAIAVRVDLYLDQLESIVSQKRTAHGLPEELKEIVEDPYLLSELFVGDAPRSEEHTSELQSLMHISYAVFCLK